MDVFFHADDFGKCSSKTKAIHRLMLDGIIERTSLLINLKGTDEAVALAKEYGYQEKVCLHLNLFEGMPMTGPIRKTGLCGASGEFCGAGRKRILATCMSPAAVHAIRKEAEAQMRSFREKGFISKHFDSHEWTLLNPPVWAAVKPLVGIYGFETTRLGSDRWISTRKWIWKHYLRFMNAQVQKTIPSEEVWSGTIKAFCATVSEEGMRKKEGRAEIYLHPDIVDGVIIDVANHERYDLKQAVESMMDLVQTVH